MVASALFIAGGTTVANADEFQVFELPETLIHISDIQTYASGECLEPTTQVQPSANAAGGSYCLEVEVFSRGLEEVTACFYNNDAVSESRPIEQLCYSNYSLTQFLTQELEDGKTVSSAPLITNQKQALFATFIPDYAPFLADDVTWGSQPPLAFPFLRGFRTNLSGEMSTFSTEDTIGGIEVGQDSAYHLNFLMAPDQRMAKGDDWRVRIRAIYGPEVGPVDAEKLTLAPEKQYQVLYFGGLASNSRPNVDYGVLAPNESVTKSGLGTARYFINAESFITLKADTPFTQGEDTIAFKDGDPGVDENALSLQCSTSGGSPIFVTDSEARKLIPTVSYDPETFTWGGGATAPTHDCTLKVGLADPLGQYTANMTVSVGEKTG